MHVEWVDNEAVVLDPESGQLHYLNPPAALFYALVLEHGYEAGLEELKRTVPESSDGDELSVLLDQMLERGLLLDG